MDALLRLVGGLPVVTGKYMVRYPKAQYRNWATPKMPVPCLEYIIVHELVHFQERHHTERFRQLMSRYLPQWPHRRALLNAAPLAHEDWRY